MTMWRRFTDNARKVILLGQEEARRMGAASVDDSHLLLGLVSMNDGGAANVLDSIGVTRQQVRQGVEKEWTPSYLGPQEPSREPTLGPRAKRVLERAAAEAQELKHNYIGTEHLLLALLRDREGMAAGVLNKVGVELENTKRKVLEYFALDPNMPEGHRTTAPTSDAGKMVSRTDHALIAVGLCLSADAKRILLRAADKALAAGVSRVDFEHLCAAVREMEAMRKPGEDDVPELHNG